MRDQYLDPELQLDLAFEADRITNFIRQSLAGTLHRRGLVVGLSGGIDSSVCAALAVRAIGPERVLGLMMPEADSSDDSRKLADVLVQHLGIEAQLEDITATLDGLDCYRRRDEAIRIALPEYQSDWKSKIVLSGASQGLINHFTVVAESPDGQRFEAALPLKAYLSIVAATNFKQRVRKTMEYFHADARNYAVVGTPNRLEYDQGFFVKNGDGAADIKPISHLYKSQVYAMARYLELPENICQTTPTTDTYSLPQGQDEFYFALPYEQMDLALLYKNQSRPAADLAKRLELDIAVAQRIYDDIEQKRKTTQYLHMSPLRLEAS
ncbi:NAD(+) synthase [Reinekea blandensis]|uniref:NH(3)-dependent NAD(+) synthetase n=1 Tax=Reinekea blandensis MED297 TaxID=314283 RepID=A4BIT7_9GAMM|nr:NAD(+) synthase [Reinekea blandensis]EAR07954.1 NAD(+) synthetase [Reinekea sp. MED297] [Reinekea blandensis MED297]